MGRWVGMIGLVGALAMPGSTNANVGDPDAVRRALEPRSQAEVEPSGEEVNLFPRVPMARAAGWFLPPEPSPSEDAERAEAELEAYFDTAIGQDRLDAGDVDGWYHETGRAMRARFRPDRNRVERERTAGMTPLQRVFAEFGRHGPPERPIDVPGEPPPELRGAVTDPTDRSQVVAQERFDWCNAVNAPTTWYRVVLQVTHNPEGVLSAARVLRSSGYEALDEAALQAAREGGRARPAPSEAVVGARQAIRSDWAFELGDVATPIGCALPTGATAELMCVDDPVQGTMCAAAGRGIVRTRVRLLAVVDATHFTPAERRAQRRADPDRPSP